MDFIYIDASAVYEILATKVHSEMLSHLIFGTVQFEVLSGHTY